MFSLLLGVLGIKLPSKAVIIGAITAIILVASMLTYYRFQLNACHKSRIQAIAELNSYITAQKVQFAKREAINKQKLENANRNLKVVNESYKLQLDQVKAEYVEQQNINTQERVANDIHIDELRGLLRDKISRDIIARNETSTNTEGDAEHWQERYATIDRQYENLKQACVITTLDFNALSGWRDEVCLMSKCGD
jgi:hypothetical protein